MKFNYAFLLLFSFGIIGPVTSISAQSDQTDNVLWSMLKLTKSINEKTSIAVTPIVRHNNDVSSYQNTSLDLSVRRQLGKGWFAQLLSRTWWIPDQKGRQFLWLDVGYSKSFSKSKLASHVRYHYALDINDRNDADFIRWKTKFTIPTAGKLKPSFAIEPWWRLNNIGEVRRMRYEPGLSYKTSMRTDFTFVYRIERSVNLSPKVKTNMFVVELQYKL